MPAKILQQRNINGKPIWYLDGRFFTHSATEFEIVGSETTGPGYYDVSHIIKNIKTTSYATIPMTKLIPLLLECEI